MTFLTLIIILSVFTASLFLRGRFFWPKVVRYSFCLSILVIFILLLLFSFLQFTEWKNSEVSQYLLPPHQPISYFIFHSFNQFFLSYLLSFGFALVFLYSAKIFNRKYKERFFEIEEPYLGALGIFLSGWPGLLFYIIFLLVFYLLFHISLLFSARSSSFRISLYYLWLPTALFAIIINDVYFSGLGWWNILKI